MDNPVRLLICPTCNSVEELPPYSGDPRNDTWLRLKEKDHLLSSGEKLHGDLKVGRIEYSDWIAHKTDILAKMASEFTAPGQGLGLGQAMYDSKDNYSSDAMRCWRVEHSRTINCADYMSSKKRILADTKQERKAEGLDTRHRPEIYLCQFCPFHQVVQQRKASEEFGYDYD